MKSLPIRVRLTAWYSLILALSIGVSGSIAYFAMSHSINAAIDVGLRHRLDGIRTIIVRTAPQGRAAIVDELNEFDEGQGGRGLVSVTDEDVYKRQQLHRGYSFPAISSNKTTTKS